MIHVGGLAAGLGMGFAYSAHAQLTFRSVAERDVGAATSSLQLCDNLGIALGTGVVGAVVAFGDDVGWAPGTAVAIAWAVPVVVAASGALLSHRLPRVAEGAPDRSPINADT
jgi:predicted MFS family arabinose efflux permease